MTISRKDVEHVARLARLELTDDEIVLFQEQLRRILEHAKRVTSLDTETIPATSHAIGLANVFRPDEPVTGLSQEEALDSAPESEAGHFRVPRILEEGSGE